MKRIRVTMTDETQWDIPAWVVCMHRANLISATLYPNYKHDIEHKRLRNLCYHKELKVNDSTLIEWANQSENWSAISKEAVYVPPEKKPEYISDWPEAPKSIVYD